MASDYQRFVGLQLNERLRVGELVEERPFSLLFRGDVLALERVVGSCCISLYRPSQKADPDDVASALRNLTKGVKSPEIYGIQQVGVLREGELSGYVYATGEPIKTTMSAQVRAGRLLGVEEAENLSSQVARALLATYEVYDVHARVRPYNLMLTSDGWKLAGLGLHTLEENLTRVSRLPDEPVYLPPENYRDGIFDRTVDSWALGICLHQGMSSRLPYEGDTSELLDLVLKDPPRIERLPGRAGSVVKGLLVEDRSERWDPQRCIDHVERPRGGEFAADLGRSSGRLGEFEGGEVGGADQSGVDSEGAPVLVDTRPLYLRPAFFSVCALCFLLSSYLGFRLAPLPAVARENEPPPLVSLDFSQTQIDDDGRRVTKTPQQATAYSEMLGPGNRIEMLQILPGTFNMGSKANEPYYQSDEGPRHQVKVGGFFISRFEITQQQWAAVAALPQVSVSLPPDPSTFKGADRPVEGVTWVEAKEFCARLSQRAGRLYRLPTEAEWEFACRAGTDTEFCFGRTINSAMSNYQATRSFAHEGKGQYRRETIPVGKLGAANYFGLMDVHGNVAEWCEDRFGPYPDKFLIDPTGPKEGKERVVRGGSWHSYPEACRAAAREAMNQDYRRNDLGFRIVLPRIIMVPADEA